ncbi:uncharacterized protein NEMAJ01_0457 [Nematocida major]|uniref:uncharacterized protein n=1 Tax=Nematocida major TaxID=1912982 RepID=UPI002007FB05|nr:uncharacterized protein NEMAJ01_0457 [Nematocida major]KAH9385561.1 hypothetical protein NEMAJ01_0457 [Nematocida major]
MKGILGRVAMAVYNTVENVAVAVLTRMKSEEKDPLTPVTDDAENLLFLTPGEYSGVYKSLHSVIAKGGKNLKPKHMQKISNLLDTVVDEAEFPEYVEQMGFLQKMCRGEEVSPEKEACFLQYVSGGSRKEAAQAEAAQENLQAEVQADTQTDTAQKNAVQADATSEEVRPSETEKAEARAPYSGQKRFSDEERLQIQEREKEAMRQTLVALGEGEIRTLYPYRRADGGYTKIEIPPEYSQYDPNLEQVKYEPETGCWVYRKADNVGKRAYGPCIAMHPKKQKMCPYIGIAPGVLPSKWYMRMKAQGLIKEERELDIDTYYSEKTSNLSRMVQEQEEKTRKAEEARIAENRRKFRAKMAEDERLGLAPSAQAVRKAEEPEQWKRMKEIEKQIEQERNSAPARNRQMKQSLGGQKACEDMIYEALKKASHEPYEPRAYKNAMGAQEGHTASLEDKKPEQEKSEAFSFGAGASLGQPGSGLGGGLFQNPPQSSMKSSFQASTLGQQQAGTSSGLLAGSQAAPMGELKKSSFQMDAPAGLQGGFAAATMNSAPKSTGNPSPLSSADSSLSTSFIANPIPTRASFSNFGELGAGPNAAHQFGSRASLGAQKDAFSFGAESPDSSSPNTPSLSSADSINLPSEIMEKPDMRAKAAPLSTQKAGLFGGLPEDTLHKQKTKMFGRLADAQENAAASEEPDRKKRLNSSSDTGMQHAQASGTMPKESPLTAFQSMLEKGMQEEKPARPLDRSEPAGFSGFSSSLGGQKPSSILGGSGKNTLGSQSPSFMGSPVGSQTGSPFSSQSPSQINSPMNSHMNSFMNSSVPSPIDSQKANFLGSPSSSPFKSQTPGPAGNLMGGFANSAMGAPMDSTKSSSAPFQSGSILGTSLGGAFNAQAGTLEASPLNAPSLGRAGTASPIGMFSNPAQTTNNSQTFGAPGMGSAQSRLAEANPFASETPQKSEGYVNPFAGKETVRKRPSFMFKK